MLWAMGFYVKTVLVILFEGFSKRFSLVGFFPSRYYYLILYGRFMLNLRLRHFGIGIAVLPGQFLASCMNMHSIVLIRSTVKEDIGCDDVSMHKL